MIISTGLCGSITTFSSWQLATYTQSNLSTQSVFHNILSFISEIIFTLGMANVSFAFGVTVPHLLHLTSSTSKHVYVEPVIVPPTFTWGIPHDQILIDTCVLFLGVAIWTLVIVISIINPSAEFPIALSYAPFGTWLRYTLAILLNSKIPTFPIGTFTGNFISYCRLIAHIHPNNTIITC